MISNSYVIDEASLPGRSAGVCWGVMGRIVLWVGVCLYLQSSPVGAQDLGGSELRYRVTDRSWQGLSQWADAAQARGIRIEIRHTVNLEEMADGAGLVVMAPGAPLPAHGLRSFLERGGRVFLADDQGRAAQTFKGFRIEQQGPPQRSSFVAGQPFLRIALAKMPHGLTHGVPAVVTNKPSTLIHPHLNALYAFESGEALVLAGAVGKGRLVASGDPSLFINAMMGFGGNERLAEALLRYLAPNPGDPLVMAGPGTQWVRGAKDWTLADRWRSLRERWAGVGSRGQDWSQILAQPGFMRIGALALWAILLGLLAWSFGLLRRPLGDPGEQASGASPIGPSGDPTKEIPGPHMTAEGVHAPRADELLARLGADPRASNSMTRALCTYVREVELYLLRITECPLPSTTDRLAEVLRQQGVDRGQVRSLLRLLGRLKRLSRGGTFGNRVLSTRRFQRGVHAMEQRLEDLTATLQGPSWEQSTVRRSP